MITIRILLPYYYKCKYPKSTLILRRPDFLSFKRLKEHFIRLDNTELDLINRDKIKLLTRTHFWRQTEFRYQTDKIDKHKFFRMRGDRIDFRKERSI